MPTPPPLNLADWMRWIESRISVQERRDTVDEDMMPAGVPAGGLQDQVLVKASNDDFDTEWVDLSTGGGGGGGGGLAGNIATKDQLGYVHHQVSAATVWTINHNMGYYPNVQAEDSALGDIVPGNVEYANDNTVRLFFSAAVGGTAYLS